MISRTQFFSPFFTPNVGKGNFEFDSAAIRTKIDIRREGKNCEKW